MRGRSPSKQERKEEGMKLDRLSINKVEEDPPLSGAYIRSLVKQLTTSSSKPKGSTMNTKYQGCVVDKSVSSSCRNSRKHGKVLGALQQQQQEHKKQVRRRLHTSRVYQERLLNMAEARKEIVTALKFHRAAMKHATEQKQQQQQQHQQQNALLSLGPFHHQSLEQDGSYSSPTSFEGVVSSSVVDTTESSATTQVNGGGLHAAMDDEGMAKMRSIGEQYQMEWNETMNLVTSAKWSNFLNKMEHGGGGDEAYHHIFDELMEFPPWFNANDGCLEQSTEDYIKDLSSP